MDSIKTKNIVIIILLLLNLTLLSLVLSDNARSAYSRHEALRGIEAVLKQNGISVADKVELKERSLPVLYVSRDTALEYENADRILGGVSVTDRGGNILLYSGENGQGEFRGTGSFSVFMRPETGRQSGDVVAAARKFAAGLGMEIYRGEDVKPTEAANGTMAVQLYCAAEGARIINCALGFVYRDGRLEAASGVRPLDNVRDSGQRSSVDVPTVLMRFIELVRSEGHVCSEITRLEICYLLRSSASGEGSLIPLWRVSTDGEEFYFNAITGHSETIGTETRQ